MSRRVFLSHTSEFAKYPEKRSFVDAAKEAVNRADCVPCDMEYFAARDQKPAQYCIDRACACDVYIGIIGLRYGSPVRDREEVSYTELEFDSVSNMPQIKRFIFLLDELARVPIGLFSDSTYAKRQETFRKRLEDSGVISKRFSDFHELEKLVYQALIEEFPVACSSRQEIERIDWRKDQSPYPGLMWFKEDYAPLFFGRDREVEAVLEKMREPQGHFLVISGASGSGKSSLVSAGLWRAVIQQGQLLGTERCRWKRMTPGAGKMGPFVKLAIGLQESFPQLTEEVDELATLLEHDAMSVGHRIATHPTDGSELVLVVDQLEELFTHGYPASTIQVFLAALVILSGDPQHRLRIVTTIRSEFIGRLAGSDSVLKQINDGFHYLVPPIAPTSWQDVVEKPAKLTGYAFERGLVDTILNEVGLEKKPGNMPLVAYALNQLFEKRQGNIFTHAAYHAMGGVLGAIAATADNIIEKLGKGVSASFDRVFAELVHLERDGIPSRKRAPLAVFQHDANATQLIRKLAGQECRILVTDEVDQVSTVEVAHEELFTAWPALKRWIDHSGEALRDIEHAEEEARRWQKGGDNPQELWLGSRAKKVLAAIEQFGKHPSPTLGRFLTPQEVLIARLNKGGLSHQDRLLIGQKLAEFGDPREGVGVKDGVPDIKWIKLLGGKVKINLEKVGWEEVSSEFTVNSFQIAKYPVTNAQFEAFLKADDGYENVEWWRDIKQSEGALKPKRPEANSPREMVSWYEAVAFCRWLSSKTMGPSIRLPTEWEWQHAATSCDSQDEYPWQGGWNDSRCNSGESGLNRPIAVGMYPAGTTQQGVDDMAGNIYQWCQNKHWGFERQDALSIDNLGMRAFRGSSFDDNIAESPLTLKRFNQYPDTRLPILGFRLAQDI
ncbi:MAG: SUMF1/EgtB/PvdO family nonheme iron enzyme [Nitrospira sp.]|nr:SUMF1/EgtB/PvdO family nonheme iron enzyme [Nitrospira sp.]